MKNLDCYRGLKLTHILFYTGLVLMLLSVLIGAAVDTEPVMVVLGAVGFIAAIGGLFCGLIYVRCPECNGSLMAGGTNSRCAPEILSPLRKRTVIV